MGFLKNHENGYWIDKLWGFGTALPSLSVLRPVWSFVRPLSIRGLEF